MDTYPILDKVKGVTIFTPKNILIAALIIVLIFLLTCNKKEVGKPIIITGEQVHDTVSLIEAQRQQIADSFNVVINKQDRLISDGKSNYDELMATYLNEVNDLQNVLSLPVPDTCKKIVSQLNNNFNQLKTTSAKKDNAARQQINNLTEQNKTQKSFIAAKDVTINKFKAIADTCASALTQLEKYAKKVKPKREISLGIIGQGNYLDLKPAIGIQAGYRNKKSWEITAAYYSNQVISIGIKKAIFRF